MGTARTEHRFQFSASAIAAAAQAEAEYHKQRMAFWADAYGTAMTTVQATARVDFKEYQVTGGVRIDAVVTYGDPAEWKRAQEAWGKIHEHRQAADRFITDARIYGTQGERIYELDSEDVHYFRLGGEARPD